MSTIKLLHDVKQAHEMNQLNRLINVIKNIERRPLPQGNINTDHFDGLFQGKVHPAGEIIGIRIEARRSMLKLAEDFFEESNEIQRGTTFNDVLRMAMNIVFDDFGEKNPTTLNSTDIDHMRNKLMTWFKDSSPTLTTHIPCILTTFPGASFFIGSIKFEHISQFVKENNGIAFKDLPENMNRSGAAWVATLDVNGCTQGRALEFADLAVDIALVGLQLVFPINYADRLSRMNAKTLPVSKSTYFRVGGNIQGSHSNQHPTLGLGAGWIEKIVSEGTKLLTSVGNRTNAYLSTLKKLPNLEQAWCDAAYWYHEGLAEPLETIAVTKLETALDVLFHAGNNAKTKQRLLQAMHLLESLRD